MPNHSAPSLKNESRKCREIAEKLTRRADIIDELLEEEVEDLISPLKGGAIALPVRSNGFSAKSEPEIARIKRIAGSKMTQAEACALVLERSSEPMTTEQILEGIKASGIPITMPKKHNHLAPVLSRKNKIFVTAGRGKWVLVKKEGRIA